MLIYMNSAAVRGVYNASAPAQRRRRAETRRQHAIADVIAVGSAVGKPRDVIEKGP